MISLLKLPFFFFLLFQFLSAVFWNKTTNLSRSLLIHSWSRSFCSFFYIILFLIQLSIHVILVSIDCIQNATLGRDRNSDSEEDVKLQLNFCRDNNYSYSRFTFLFSVTNSGDAGVPW